jgi:hypothetical protein
MKCSDQDDTITSKESLTSTANTSDLIIGIPPKVSIPASIERIRRERRETLDRGSSLFKERKELHLAI